MVKFKIGSNEYIIPELDMNFIIDIGEYGIKFDDFFNEGSLFKVLRAVIAISSGKTLEEAGAEMQAAMINQEFDKIATAYQEALEQSGFFQAILKEAEKSQGASDQSMDNTENSTGNEKSPKSKQQKVRPAEK